MPTPTYTFISSNTLISDTTLVIFSNIPTSYTDLLLTISARVNSATTGSSGGIYFNSIQGTSYSMTKLSGSGSVANSQRESYTDAIEIGVSVGANATSNIFSNSEIYIPNYTSSIKKQTSSFGAGENNATAAIVSITAGLTQITSSITSLTIYDRGFSGKFVSGSSFYLYGIKKQ